MTAQPDFVPFIHTLGRGPRRVLALHCTLAFGGAWSALANVLADELTLVAPDMPSHGKSADWDTISHVGDTAFAGALAAMDDGPMDVIGHSFGAATALRLAVEYPDKMRSLTVFEPVLFAIANRDAPETIAENEARLKPYHDAVAVGDWETAARLFNRAWSERGPRWNDMPPRLRAAMTRAIPVVPAGQGFLFDDDRGLLKPGALDSVEVPTLILRGENAASSVVATNDGLERRMPNATQAVIQGAGHMAPITHPAEVAVVWGKFLKRT